MSEHQWPDLLYLYITFPNSDKRMQIAFPPRTASCQSARSSISRTCKTALDESLKYRKTTLIGHIFAIYFIFFGFHVPISILVLYGRENGPLIVVFISLLCVCEVLCSQCGEGKRYCQCNEYRVVQWIDNSKESRHVWKQCQRGQWGW